MNHDDQPVPGTSLPSRRTWGRPASAVGLLILLLAGGSQALGVPSARHEHRVNVGAQALYPATVIISPGDTVTWYGDAPSEQHWILSLLPDFSGPPPNPDIDSGFHAGVFTFSKTFTDVDAGKVFVWGDVVNPAGSGFGQVIVRGDRDVFLDFYVFSGDPPISNGYQLEPYPKDLTIERGTRVIWQSPREPLINHLMLLTDRKFRAEFPQPYGHPFPFHRRSSYFAYQFDVPGVYGYICPIHPNMRGTITVCRDGGHDSAAAPGDRRRCAQ